MPSLMSVCMAAREELKQTDTQRELRFIRWYIRCGATNHQISAKIRLRAYKQCKQIGTISTTVTEINVGKGGLLTSIHKEDIR